MGGERFLGWLDHLLRVVSYCCCRNVMVWPDRVGEKKERGEGAVDDDQKTNR